jgi:hypothetical protein
MKNLSEVVFNPDSPVMMLERENISSKIAKKISQS